MNGEYGGLSQIINHVIAIDKSYIAVELKDAADPITFWEAAIINSTEDFYAAKTIVRERFMPTMAVELYAIYLHTQSSSLGHIMTFDRYSYLEFNPNIHPIASDWFKFIPWEYYGTSQGML